MCRAVISIALSIVTVFCCGCSGTKAINEVTIAEPGYSCKAKIYYGSDLNFDAELSVVGGGVFSVKLIKPDALKGLTFSFDNGKMTVEYKGITGGLGSAAQYGGFAEILDSVFLKISTGGSVAILKENKYTYMGISDGEDFVLTVNDKGFPTKLKIENLGFDAEFSDWQY